MTSAVELRDALERGDSERVLELLAAGAGFVLDDHGVTALHYAVRLNSGEMARLLLEHGGDEYVLLGTMWPHVKSPLLEAVRWGNTEMVTLLVAYAARRFERGPHLGAGTEPSMSGLKLARNLEANAHAKLQEQLDSALLTAASNGHLDVVKVLLQNGADPNCYPWGEDKRHRPLVAAAAAGFADVVAVLLQSGGDVEVIEEGKTALHRASAAGREEVVQLLLTAGAEVGATDEAGCTPLHLAAAKGFDRIAALLLDHGADPNAPNAGQQTPRYVAPSHSEVARLLGRRGGRLRPFWKGLLKHL